MKERFFETLQSVNALPPRAYYVPFKTTDVPSEKREDSGEFFSLNGVWTIKEYKSFFDVPDNFYEQVPTTEIPVPSCVQYFGFDNFQYTNVNYAIPYNPPYVPNENPCYHFHREAELRLGARKYLLFEGVDSCFYLYVNGRFVGFFTCPHATSEFDVTDYVKEGVNSFDVLVLKWGAGTYLEDQDKWRFTGIFRDVYLLSRPQGHVRDYAIRTALDGTVSFTSYGASVAVTFVGETQTVADGETVTFKVKNPKLWSAETPYLYPMTIEGAGEIIYENVGIRTTEVKNRKYLLNGKPVKFKGVNRHDFHPDKGAAVSLSDVERDLRLMKELNVNAIRTSHYPSCPEMYKLCDKYGFYVISESDVETHGVQTRKPDWSGNFDEIANSPIFEDGILLRQTYNVHSQKNRPSVVIWSLGNESGWGENFRKAANWVKANDSRPVHYESIYFDPKSDRDDSKAPELDFISRMYPALDWLNEYLQDEQETRPCVLCEYCHSMGNGPGDFKQYWDILNSSDYFCGGFVWEWADHGVRVDGKGFYYGGDFGEYPHDGNFCVDGIVSPDRACDGGTAEMKKIYEPVRFEACESGVKITSVQYFENMELLAKIEYMQAGKVVKTAKATVKLKPNQSVVLLLEKAQATSVKLYRKNGAETASYATFDDSLKEAVRYPDCQQWANIWEEGRYIRAEYANKKYMFDKCSGQLVAWEQDGNNLLSAPLELTLFRAPTDNDRFIKNEWNKYDLANATFEVREAKIDGQTISFAGNVCRAPVETILKATLSYRFEKGGVFVGVAYEKQSFNAYLPRVGVRFALPLSFDEAEYLGYGAQEAYIDKRISASKNYYAYRVSENGCHYIKPQEYGSHYATEYLCLTDGTTAVKATGNFSFSARPYSDREIAGAAHNWELLAPVAVHVNIDYVMSGIGSQSCGPALLEEFRAPDQGEGEFFLWAE